MTEKVRFIQVQNQKSADRQLRLHLLQALSHGILEEKLAHRERAPSSRPYVQKGELAGHEIGTALSKLEAQIIPMRQAGVRTPEQDVLLSSLEARYRAACRDAAEVSTGGRASGQLGVYRYWVPNIEIRTGTELERREGCWIPFDVADAPPRVRGAYAALEVFYGAGGLERMPVVERRGMLDVNRQLDPIVHMYWSIVLDWVELIRLEGERKRRGVELEVPAVTEGISDQYKAEIRARYSAA